MTTEGFDPATPAVGLLELQQRMGGDQWRSGVDGSAPELQERFLAWLYGNQPAIEKLRSLKSMVSSNATELNKFLTDNGFEPLFREMLGDSLGIAVILDMLIEWATEGTVTDIEVFNQGTYRVYPGFIVELANVEIFRVGGSQLNLIRLSTKSGDSVWMMMCTRPADAMSHVNIAEMAMRDRVDTGTGLISSVVVPMLEINLSVPLEWMLGIKNDASYIRQAFQMIKLRLNQTGARVKAATGLVAARGLEPRREPLVFDRPFLLWITQQGSEVPIAPVYADYDTWRLPTGTLEEL